MIKNISTSEIKNSKLLQKKFLNSYFEDLKINCNSYKGNFYLDSFNYFLIDDKYRSFESLFSRDPNLENKHFLTKIFFDRLSSNLDNLKEFKNTFILGSNAGNNYYSNLLQFIPRIFFINSDNIKIAIHRNSSAKLREFIKLILNKKNIKFSFVYLDDGFYKFKDCEMPQFFKLEKSINILKKFLVPNETKSNDKKIYVTREDSEYRKIINESDIVPILRSKGYKVINPQLYKIEEQIKIFSEANKIISPHGSNLANIIFCKPGTEIFEIGPQYVYDYEKVFENRYKYLADINDLKYTRLICDSVPVNQYSDTAENYINKRILNESNYYKNLIVKVKEIETIE